MLDAPMRSAGLSQQSLGELIADIENKFDVEFPEDWVSQGLDRTPSDIIDVICEQKDIIRS
jgi:acyl carrier protein